MIAALLLSLQLLLPLLTLPSRLVPPHSLPPPLLTPCLPCFLAPLPPPLRHGVGRPLYAGLKTRAQLETPTCRLCMVPRRPNYELGDGPTERLPDPYGAHPRTLMQCNKATFHQIMVNSPVGEGVCHPVCQIGDDDSEIF